MQVLTGGTRKQSKGSDQPGGLVLLVQGGTLAHLVQAVVRAVAVAATTAALLHGFQQVAALQRVSSLWRLHHQSVERRLRLLPVLLLRLRWRWRVVATAAVVRVAVVRMAVVTVPAAAVPKATLHKLHTASSSCCCIVGSDATTVCCSSGCCCCCGLTGCMGAAGARLLSCGFHHAGSVC